MRNKKGFTLIELLVVIAIIGILATIVLVSLNSARLRSRDVRRVSDLRQVALALEMYASENGGYPVSATCTSATFGTMISTLVTAGFLPSVPLDPTNDATLFYAYGATAKTSYTLKATLESGTSDALETDIDTTSDTCTCTDPAYCVGP